MRYLFSKNKNQMKNLAMLLVVIFNLTSCMNNKQDKVKNTSLPEAFFEGNDLLMAKAIYAADIAEIEKLITVAHFNPNTRGSHLKSKYSETPCQYTYLGYSILVGEIKAAEKLLEFGADVNSVSLDKGVYTNIGMAFMNKNKNMINLLLKYKVNLNPHLSSSPFDALLIGGTDRSLFDLLIANGADVNHKEYIGGGGPLIATFYVEKIAYMHYFLDKGADPTQINYLGSSFAYMIQSELDEGRLTGKSLVAYQEIKERLSTEFHVNFPLKNLYRKALEESIQRYNSLTKEEKTLLGKDEVERMNLFKKSLISGKSPGGATLDN